MNLLPKYNQAPGAWRALFRGLLWSLLAALFEALPYLLLCRALLAVFQGRNDFALVASSGGGLLLAGVLLLVARSRANIEGYGATYRLVAEARLRLADHLARLPQGTLDRQRRAALIELLGGRFELYQNLMARVWGNVQVNLTLALALWSLLFWLEPRLAIAVALPVPLAFAVIPWSRRLLFNASARLAEARNDWLARLLEQIEGARELREYDLERRRLKELEARLEHYCQAQMRTELAPGPLLLGFAMFLQLGLALAAALAVWTPPASAEGIATAILALLLAVRLYRSLTELGLNLAELRYADSVLEEIRQVAALPAQDWSEHGPQPADASLCFEAVGYRYPGTSQTALSDFSAELPAGARVALVGTSGSGKSTLVQLLTRLRDVDAGVIRLGGVDLRELPAASLARRIAVIQQEVQLFPLSVADNIRLGRPDATLEQVHEAARLAAAEHFIERLPQGYDTRLEDGLDLSGGERQRLAIARALLKDAPILILDEATASLDGDNERQVREALANLARGRTLLVIAHRLWTVVDADEIWVLDGGRLVQRGSHEQLLAQNGGLYRRLWDAQQSV